MQSADQSSTIRRMQSQLGALRTEKERLKNRLAGLVEKVDPLLLLFGDDPKQRIRQICQEEMIRYRLIDSYSLNKNG